MDRRLASALLLVVASMLVVSTQTACTGGADAQDDQARSRADFVRSHLRATSISFTYEKSKDDARPGVRNFTVTFEGSITPREPIGLYADGSPVEEVLLLTPDTMRVVVDHLAKAAFFKKSLRWHSVWQTDTTVPPPADSQPFTPDLFERSPAGGIRVRLTTSADGWHHSYVLTYPHDHATRQMLIGLSTQLPDAERESLERGLLGKMR